MPRTLRDDCCTECAAMDVVCATCSELQKQIPATSVAPPSVGSGEWMDALAKRIERHADDIDPHKNPPLRPSYERAEDLRTIAKTLRERGESASIEKLTDTGERNVGKADNER